MSYTVSKEVLEARFDEWKRAMLIEIYHSLSFDYNIIEINNFEIKNVTQFNLLISGMSSLLHTRYRGEARYHNNPCLPIIARNPKRGYNELYEISEINRFKYSEIGKQYLNELEDKSVIWWLLAQHYSGFESRLLDITRNPLIALFFACEKHQDKDGYVYVFHSTDKTSIPMNPKYSNDYEVHIRDPDNYYTDNTFVYVRPNIALDRINRQEAEFLWIKNYHDLVIKGLYEKEQVVPIIIKKEYKEKILNELNDPQGINWPFLNPEKF